MVKIHSRLRVPSPRLSRVVLPGVLLLMSTPYLAALNVAVADDEDSDSPIDFTTEELIRARVLFRHYCMDCHGPKMTGDEHDENLLCPDVQGKDQDDYQEAMLEGPDDMPEFKESFIDDSSNGYLILSTKDFKLLTQHETTFRPNQP